jgi:ribosomal protein S18 acetylase RimI-like enzyme
VGDRPEDGPGLTIRPGEPADSPYVVALGAEAFARFGDYAPVMTEFLQSPDVASFIAWSSGERVGFALVDTGAEPSGLADLVAIAVDPRHRRKGVGRALLSRVIAAFGERDTSAVLILTVADDNHAAIELFRSRGFEMIPGSVGRYAGGQTSRRMVRIGRP